MSSVLIKLSLFFSLLFPLTTHAQVSIGITVDDIPAAGNNAPKRSRLEIAKKYLKEVKKLDLPKQFGFANGVYIEHMAERKTITDLWKKDHYLGNHTFSHAGLTKLSSKEYIEDIKKNESFIGYNSKTQDKYFRYPFLDEGSTNDKRYDIRYFLSQAKYKIAQVSIDSSDWKWNLEYLKCLQAGKNLAEYQEQYANYILQISIAKQKQKNIIWGQQKELKHILLLHLNPLNADSIGLVYKKLKANGFQFIDAKEALDDPIYFEDSTYMGRDGKDFLEQNIISRKLTDRPEAILPKVPEKLTTLCN